MYLVACSTHPSQRKSARTGKAWELFHHLVSISIFVKLFTFYAQVQMWKIIVLYKVAVGRFVGGKKFSVENLCWENSQENRCCMCEMRGISCSWLGSIGFIGVFFKPDTGAMQIKLTYLLTSLILASLVEMPNLLKIVEMSKLLTNSGDA